MAKRNNSNNNNIHKSKLKKALRTTFEEYEEYVKVNGPVKNGDLKERRVKVGK